MYSSDGHRTAEAGIDRLYAEIDRQEALIEDLMAEQVKIDGEWAGRVFEAEQRSQVLEEAIMAINAHTNVVLGALNGVRTVEKAPVTADACTCPMCIKGNHTGCMKAVV